MALDPESIGIFVGTVLSSAGATIGGLKVIDWYKPGRNGNGRPTLCDAHHDLVDKVDRCFDEMSRRQVQILEDVAYIRGFLDQKRD